MNKYQFSILFTLFQVFFVFAETDAEIEKRYEEEKAAYYEYMVYLGELQEAFAKQIKKELNLRFSGSGGLLGGTIEALEVEFYADRRATIEEARALLLLIVEKFVDAVRADEKLQPFLETTPFTYKQVTVSICFSGINGGYSDGSVHQIYKTAEYSPPENRNRLFYRAKDPFTRDLVRNFEESYEEAVKRNADTPVKDPHLHDAAEHEEVIDNFLFSFREDICLKHYMECWSIGQKFKDGLEEIGAYFVMQRQATQEEARALILDIVKSHLEAINRCEKLKPYLAKEPFTFEGLKLRLCFKKRNCTPYRNGTMESVTLDEGRLTYFREMPREERKKLGYVPEVQTYASESYEEALEKNIGIKDSSTSLFGKIQSFLTKRFF